MRSVIVRIFLLSILTMFSGCATLICTETDSAETCAAKKRDAWQRAASAMANASKPTGYQQCESRAAALSKSEIVVGQECETIPPTATSNERQICKSVTETRMDTEKYSAILQQCQAELRRDARQQQKEDNESILKPIDCEMYPNAAGCYGRKK
jgi:hypothetical protein